MAQHEDFEGYEGWLDELDSLDQLKYEDDRREAAMIADSYPRDEEQRLTQSWLDSINSTLRRTNATLIASGRAYRRAA